jgi:hypothetical protein
LSDETHFDAEPATLTGAGKSIDYPTLQEAVMAWHRLPPERARQAMIKGTGGRIYTAIEILHFHYRPKPT